MADGNSKVVRYSDGSLGKIIEAGHGTEQIHLHKHSGGLTISRYDKATGSAVSNYDGTPQRFTWSPRK